MKTILLTIGLSPGLGGAAIAQGTRYPWDGPSDLGCVFPIHGGDDHGGLAFASILTLVAAPVLYYLFFCLGRSPKTKPA